MPKEMSPDLMGLLRGPLAQQSPPSEGIDPTTPETFVHPAYGILALGIVVLVLWIVRRAAHPQKLLLRRIPGRPNTLHILHPVGLILIYFAWLQATSFLPASWRYAAVCGVQFTVFLLALVVAGQTFRRGTKRGLGLTLRRWKTDTARGLIAFLASLPVLLGLTIFLAWLFPQSQQNHPALEEMKQTDLFGKALLIFSATILAPLMEEVVFRGFLQTTLRKYLGSPWLGILGASVSFAIVHPVWVHWPVLFVLALVLGYNYERTGRLWSSIVLHSTFNAYNVYLFLQN